MKLKSDVWYSFSGLKPDTDQVGFYNTDEYDWTEYIEQKYHIIKDELLRYIHSKEDEIKPYFNKNLVSERSIWRTSAFLFWKWNFRKNQASCPQTMKILERIPNLVSSSISILEPGSEIKPHRGDTNGIMRGHFPLVVPNDLNNLGFKVKEETVVWKEGKLILFNDAAYHSAWNKSDSNRIIMIIDVIRPEFASKSYRISSTILSSLLYQNISIKNKAMKQLPQSLRSFLIKSVAIFINLILRVQNFRT